MTRYSAVELDTKAGVGELQLARPELQNRFDTTLLSELGTALQELADDPWVRAVVLSSTGKHFSAGGNTEAMLNANRDLQALLAQVDEGRRLFRTFADSPKPLVAGVRRILRDVVEPEVASEYARSRVRKARAVLAQIDWDDAALSVRRQRSSERSLLAAARTWMTSAPDRTSAFQARASRLPGADDEQSTETFDQVNAAHAVEAALLVEVSAALARWPREHPDDASAHELRRQPAAGLAAGGARS